jgi:Ctr copper transporter family
MLAIVGTFIFAFGMEGFSKLRHRLVRIAKVQASSCGRNRTNSSTSTTASSRNTDYLNQQSNNTSNNSNNEWYNINKWNPIILRFSITLLHGMQALFGYILMLISMTFSIELLCAVVLGLASGYGTFFHWNASTGPDDDGLSVRHVTSNPCCEFMEEEGKEIFIAKKNNTQHPYYNNYHQYSENTHTDGGVGGVGGLTASGLISGGVTISHGVVDEEGGRSNRAGDETLIATSTSLSCCSGDPQLQPQIQNRYPNEI